MYRKFPAFIVIFAAINLIYVGSILAQKSSTDGVWQKVNDSGLAQTESVQRLIIPAQYETFRVNKTALDGILKSAPREFTPAAKESEMLLTIPMPDGGFERFRIENSPIMESGLAEKYPDIQSFRGQGIDNPTASVRFDISPNGFRAQILSNQGSILIEPFAQGDTTNYISFYKMNAPRSADGFSCLIKRGNILSSPEQFNFFPQAPEVIIGSQLRTYRLALAATAEYTNVFRQAGDTDAQAKVRALAQINTTMNRVNQVYERELAIRMVLIANTDALIYTNASTDPYTNDDGEVMLDQNQANINSVIGSANYDIGHVFSTGGGGIAMLFGSCSSAKAQGVTGMSNPVGDAFAIDYVAHEIGHQFGAEHTFNGTSSSCGFGNRTASAAYEPGSGVTIMAYAGICGNQNLANNSIDTFHVKSLEEISNFVAISGNCSANTPTGNTPPSISAVGGTTWNIPKQTPFALNASATDANGDSVTYDWQQYDLGGATTSVPNSDSDGQTRPIFRPYAPVTSGTRYFPSLQYIRNNANVPPSTTGGLLTGELLPAITRTMKFQAIARDNRTGGGGVSTVMVQVSVDGNSGPFAVTAPNTAVNWTGNTQQTVTWSVANTANAPVNAANVKISLSTDGGLTFPITILASTANDGSEMITVPNVSTSQARIKIEGVNNIFFDMSNTNFTITQGIAAPPRKLFDFDGDGKSDIGVFRPSDGGWYLLRSQSGFTATQFGIATDKIVSADYDGDGKADVAVFRAGNWYWLNSSNNSFNGVQFGAATDLPVTGDFDGDRRDDQAVFRSGAWFIRQSSNGLLRSEQFGSAGDKPVVGDYDGDTKSDIAVFRPSDGNWYLLRSQLGFAGVQFGIGTDVPTPADYDGDGKTDPAVYRAGTWYLQRSQLGFTGVLFGAAADIPTPGDFDGDNKADISVFRPLDGTWYQQRSATGFTATQFGTLGDMPVGGRY